jgi:DNA-binding CsgD family transcriptional regulator
VSIAEFIEATSRAASPLEVVGHFQRALDALGYDYLHYVALQPHPHSDGHCIASSYPEAWTDRYVEQGYGAVDPLLRHGRRYRTAFQWSDLARQTRFTGQESLIMDEARAAGLHDGIGIPLHGPVGETLGVSVASARPHPDAGRLLARVSVLAVQFHTAYSVFALPRSWSPETGLTARECEILQWAARGKSNWAIGEILHISEHGVDYHLRKILRKLDADSRVTAVVKALTQGLIAP